MTNLFFSIVTNAPVLATLLGFIVLMVAVLLHHRREMRKIEQLANLRPLLGSSILNRDQPHHED